MKIPEFLIQAIKNNTTSLGDHPAFPPEEEETFVAFLLKTQYKTIMSMFNEEDTTTKTISKKLSELLAECQKIEATNKEALEKFKAMSKDVLQKRIDEALAKGLSPDTGKD